MHDDRDEGRRNGERAREHLAGEFGPRTMVTMHEYPHPGNRVPPERTNFVVDPVRESIEMKRAWMRPIDHVKEKARLYGMPKGQTKLRDVMGHLLEKNKL